MKDSGNDEGIHMSDQPLFNTKRIEEVRSEARTKLERSIASLGSLSEVDAPDTAKWLREGAMLELPTIDRTAATFETREEGAALLVTVTIPVPTGSSIMFWVRPTTSGLSPPVGTVKSVNRGSSEVPRLQSTGKFTRDPSSDEIKDWARKYADVVQQHIDWLAPDVAMHNDDVEKIMERGLERRRQQLAELGKLRNDLSGGI